MINAFIFSSHLHSYLEALKCTETFFQWFMPNLYYFSAIRIPKMGRWRLWNQIPSLTFFPIFLQSKANKRYWIDIFFLWRLLWEWAVALVFLVSYCGRLLLLLYCGCKCGVFCVFNPPTLSLSVEAAWEMNFWWPRSLHDQRWVIKLRRLFCPSPRWSNAMIATYCIYVTVRKFK